MFIKFLRSVFLSTPRKTSGTGKVASNTSASLIDVLHEVAKNESGDLRQLVAAGLPSMRKKQRREVIKKRVSQAMSKEFASDPLLVDEVTERIIDASEFDPYYGKLFIEEEIK